MIRVALVGCGHMGQHHARVVASHPECSLVSVRDHDPARAHAVARRYGAEVARGEVDADVVVVAVPTEHHIAEAQRAVATGAWVLVEKPLAADRAQAEVLLSPRVRVGHVERFNPAVRSVLAQRGRLEGAMLRAERVVARRPGGAHSDVVLDLMVHDLDLLLWSRSASVVSVVARQPTPSSVLVQLGLSDGSEAILHAGRTGTPRRIVSTDAGLSLDLARGQAWHHGQPLPDAGPHDGLEAQWAALLAEMGGAPRALASVAEALAVLHTVERIHQALETPITVLGDGLQA